MNRRFASSLCAGLVLLSACSKEPLQGGIEGSGITPVRPAAITTSGEVTALGSIVVNDVTYDLAGATIIIDGSPASESDLAPGQVTIVEGELVAGGTHGTAKRVSVETSVAGRIAAVDVALGRVTILGQPVAIDLGTIIEDGVEGNPVGGLDVGRDVQVSGFTDSAGVLHATRVDSRKITTPLIVTGRVSNLDPNARTFSVNGQVVGYATATFRGFASPAEGAAVRVVATNLDRGTLVADEVSLRSAGLPGAPGATAALQGLVTRFASESDFDVDGRRVARTLEPSERASIVGLDAFVSVRGALLADGVVQASAVVAVSPGRLAGGVTIDGVEYGISGILTDDGISRLNIEEVSGGPHVRDPAHSQLIGHFTFNGRAATGTGVLIGEACALPPGGRFCGRETPVRLEVTKTGSAIDQGTSGVIRVATDRGEEIWPLRLGYSGGRPGFDPNWFSGLAGVYELHQAEFVQGSDVLMTVYGDGRLFFQSADTGCTGNGRLSSRYVNINLYHVTLKLEGCSGSFSYLNADFEGFSTLESLTPWDYDFSVLQMWISTPAGATSPAAITFWATLVD